MTCALRQEDGVYWRAPFPTHLRSETSGTAERAVRR